MVASSRIRTTTNPGHTQHMKDELIMDSLVLRKKLQSGAPLVSVAIGAQAPFLLESMNQLEGYDAVLLDFQHGLGTEADMIPSFQAIRAGGSVPFPRVGWNDAHQISRILDAGALGIICPMVNSKAEAEYFVGASRYAPVGFRSYGPLVAGSVYEDYGDKANEAIITLAMIETQQALDNLEEIVSVPGLDGLFVGQSDLGLSMGHGLASNWREGEVYEATMRIRDAALAAGKIAGIMANSPAFGREMLDAGFKFIGAPFGGLMFGAIQSALDEMLGARP